MKSSKEFTENSKYKEIVIKDLLTCKKEMEAGKILSPTKGWEMLSDYYDELMNLTTDRAELIEYSEGNLSALKNATELAPEVAQYWFQLGKAYMRHTAFLNGLNEQAEGYEKSFKCFSKAVKLEPENEKYRDFVDGMKQGIESVDKKK
jgi:tetratricopeptide (TPR) repeat protein